MKTTADAEANIGKVANDVWKQYYNLNKLIPFHKLKDGFKITHGMDVEPDANANVDPRSNYARN